jgi:flagellar basal body P-ring formation protein FlgA
MKKIILSLMISLFSSASFAVEIAQPQSYIFNITYEDAEAAIGKALSEKSTDGKTISVSIIGKKPVPIYSSNKPVDVEVRGLRSDDKISRWTANLIITGQDNVVSAMPLSGRFSVMKELAVLKRFLRSGDVISESDVELKSFPQERVNSDNIIDASRLIGRSPIRTVSPNRPIRESEISAPAIIKKNALVQMRYKTKNMEITTAGQALADGAKGDVIEVRNTTSKKITQAVVSDNNIVDVVGGGTQTSQIIPSQIVPNQAGVVYAK